MAVLEEEGYIRQPHTSAGRVPTDRGYRLFVDRLSRVKPLSPAERRAIERFLVGAVDLDDVVHRTVRLLAQLTRQVAVVQYPSLARSVGAPPGAGADLHHPADAGDDRRHRPGRAAAGRAARRRSPADDVTDLRRLVNEKLGGQRLVDTPPLVQALVDEAPPDACARRWPRLASVLLETLVERSEERLALAGTANLTRGGVLDFQGTLRPILEALEEEVILLKLIGEVEPSTTAGPHRRRERDRQPAVDVGGQHRLRSGRHRSSAGSACSGPTRMDYPGTIATVRAVARYVGDLLAQN